VIEPLSGEERRRIPRGFNNNILWNLGHVVVSQQLLHYGQAGLPLLVSNATRDQFRRGTSPADWTDEPDDQILLQMAVELPGRLRADYLAGRFKDYSPYTTLSGIVLPDIESAISFNNYHEGLHMGVIRAMKKLLC
jgi:hypothetical protein